jgi:hypothetical protein
MSRGQAVRAGLGLLLCLGLLGALPAIALAGSISGTVTAENGGAPIAGERVCQYERSGAIEESCTQTDSGGHYAFSGLPAGSYVIGFSGQPGNLPWEDEIYNDKRYSWEADLVTIAAAQSLSGVDAALAEGGSISGVVTERGTGTPIAGIWACAIDSEGIPARCASTGAGGEYRLNGLRSGQYSVEFEGGNRVNYLREFYKDAQTWAAAEDVAVTAPNLTAGIDQALSPGAQILGHVSEAGSGGPYAEVDVCAEDRLSEFEDCAWTDSAGNYALRSLPVGEYLVGFGIEYLPFSGRHAAQWWQGVAEKPEATPIAIAPPETREGIDAVLVNPSPPKQEVVTVTITPTTPRSTAPGPLRCRKGFRKKKVNGKLRCVKKHKRHRHHRHHHRRHR